MEKILSQKNKITKNNQLLQCSCVSKNISAIWIVSALVSEGIPIENISSNFLWSKPHRRKREGLSFKSPGHRFSRHLLQNFGAEEDGHLAVL